MPGRFTHIELPDPETGDTQQYRIQYNMLAWDAAAEALGVEPGQLPNVEGNVKAFCILLWAGLQTFHPELTLKDIMVRVDMQNLEYVTERLNAEWGRALPQEAGAEGNGPTVTASGTSRSGRKRRIASA